MGPQEEIDGPYKDIAEETVMRGLFTELWAWLKRN